MRNLAEPVARLLRDRSVRLGVAAFAGAAFVVFVSTSGGGLFLTVEAVLLAGTFPFLTARPLLAVLLAGLALLVAVVRGSVDISDLPTIAPFVVVAAPVLAGSASSRAVTRRAAAVLALLAAVAAALWAGSSGPARGVLLVPCFVVCLLPVIAGNAWRNDRIRSRVLQEARSRLPGILAASTPSFPRLSAAGGIYALCVLLDLTRGEATTLVAALPICAAMLWMQSRPDVALALCALGLAAMGVGTTLDGRFGAGGWVALLVVALVVFLASASGTERYRRLAVVLAASAALGGAVVTGSVGIGLGLLVLAALPVGGGWLTRESSSVRRLADRLTESQQTQRRAEEEVVVEQERTRVAREVHDVVAHSLAVVIAQADGARYAASTDPVSVGPALEAIAETAREALGEVRELLHELRSTEPGEPGPPDADRLVERMRDLGITVHVSRYGEAVELGADREHVLYRIVQEALTNALRHGDAGEPVEIDYDWTADGVTVTITNAVGAAATDGVVGHGIEGMRERAALCGGVLIAGLGTSGLFRVRASLPVSRGGSHPAERSGSELRELFGALAGA